MVIPDSIGVNVAMDQESATYFGAAVGGFIAVGMIVGIVVGVLIARTTA